MNLQVASNGSSIQTARGPQSLLTDKTPLTKLDTTKLESFQTISILLNHEPPQPDPVSQISVTQLYQFKHTYNYIPAIWMAWQNPAPAYPSPPGPGGTATTFNAFGDETASSNISGVGTSTSLELLSVVSYYDPFIGFPQNFTAAYLYCIIDDTYATIYLNKVAFRKDSGGSIVPLFLIGTTINLRMYVFTEPADTSIY